MSIVFNEERTRTTPWTFNTYAASHDPDWWRKDPEYRRKFREDYMKAQGDPGYVQPDREFIAVMRQAFNYAQTVAAGDYAKSQGATLNNPLGASLAKIQPLNLRLTGLIPDERTDQTAAAEPSDSFRSAMQNDASWQISRQMSDSFLTQTEFYDKYYPAWRKDATIITPDIGQEYWALRHVDDPKVMKADVSTTESPLSFSVSPESIPAPPAAVQGLVGDAGPEAQMAQIRALPLGEPEMQPGVLLDTRMMPGEFDLGYEPRAINADYQSDMIPQSSSPAVTQSDIAAVTAVKTIPVPTQGQIHAKNNLLRNKLTQQLSDAQANFTKIRSQNKITLQGLPSQQSRVTFTRDVDARYTVYLQGIENRIGKGQFDQNTQIMPIEKFVKSTYPDGANVWYKYIAQINNSNPMQNGQPTVTKTQSDPLPYIKTDKYTQTQWNAARQLSDLKKGPGAALLDLYRNHKIKVGDQISVMLTERYNRAHNTKYTPQAFYDKYVKIKK